LQSDGKIRDKQHKLHAATQQHKLHAATQQHKLHAATQQHKLHAATHDPTVSHQRSRSRPQTQMIYLDVDIIYDGSLCLKQCGIKIILSG
jgi:hypothetical protein